MTTERVEWRLERKFIVPPTALESAERIILQHPSLFSEIFAARTVHSIYLDTSRLTGYFESLSGVAQREKFRLRWYGQGAELTGSEVSFEIKGKRGWVSRKRVIPLGKLPEGVPTRAAVAEALERLEATGAFPGLAARIPVLLVRYRRRYWRSACGLFRLTLDTEIEYARVSGNVLSPWPGARNGVMELKYGVEVDEKAQAITQHLPFRLTRNSKYANGIAATHA